MFINIPIDLALKSIEKRWDLISKNTSIPLNEFLIGIRLILNSTFFKFNDLIYQQTFGTPMSSPLSPLIADLVIQDLEIDIFRQLPFNLPIFYRYVDDIIVLAPSSHIKFILQCFNSYHNRINFTLEEGNNGINFLDITIIKNGNSLIFDWYRKSTWSGRYLNYLSHHPITHKRGVIYGLIDKIFLLSHPKFHYKNLNIVIETLLKNSYPIMFIFTTINERIKYNIHKLNKTNSNNNDNHSAKYFTIPFINSIYNPINTIAKQFKLKLAFSINNNLNNFIKVGKDKLDLTAHSEVVYLIPCKDCQATYVGQTKRQLHTRIKEHKTDINKNNASPSAITLHRLESSHEIDWDNIKILDEEHIYNKRLISEMIYIKRQKNGLNNQNDTVSLPDSYSPIINSLPPF